MKDFNLDEGRGPSASVRLDALITGGASREELHEAVDQVLLKRALALHGHNLSALAKALGLSRDRVREQLRAFELDSPSRGRLQSRSRQHRRCG